MQLAEVCLSVDAALAEANISRHTARAIPEGRYSSFRIAPEPFSVSESTADELATIGSWLRDFYHAADHLYRLSLANEIPAFLATHLDAGKPPWMVMVAQSESFRDQIPIIIRPDLLFTGNGTRAAELDSVPGSMGLLAFLEATYAKLGFSVLGQQPTGQAFLQALQSLPGEEGLSVIIISEECSGYKPETSWLAEQWQKMDEKAPLVVTPEQLAYDDHGVWLNGRLVTRVYRFFELFDWENVPNSHALLHLAAVGKVVITPPPKPYLEEKMWFAFLNHPELELSWRSFLSDEVFAGLQALFPPTWLVTDGQRASQQGPLGSWQRLQRTSRRERPYVLKPSGFSALAWGGHGFSRGKDYTTKLWSETIDGLLRQSAYSPYILQEYQHSVPRDISFYDAPSEELRQFTGKTRLCPYYFLKQSPTRGLGQEEVIFSGALATTVPLSKPVIHGMTDAVMSPTSIKS